MEKTRNLCGNQGLGRRSFCQSSLPYILDTTIFGLSELFQTSKVAKFSFRFIFQIYFRNGVLTIQNLKKMRAIMCPLCLVLYYTDQSEGLAASCVVWRALCMEVTMTNRFFLARDGTIHRGLCQSEQGYRSKTQTRQEARGVRSVIMRR